MNYSGNIEQGFLVYPRVTGCTLFEWINVKRREFLDPGCTPARRAAIRKASFRILLDAIEALLQFHGAGWIHRDVHMANIMVEQSTGRALLIDTQLAARVTGVGGELPCVPTPAAQSYWVHEDSGTRHQGPLTDAFSVAALVVMTFLLSTRGDLFCDPDAVYTVLTPAANVQAVPVAAAIHDKVQLLLQSCAHARALPTRNRAPLALIYQQLLQLDETPGAEQHFPNTFQVVSGKRVIAVHAGTAPGTAGPDAKPATKRLKVELPHDPATRFFQPVEKRLCVTGGSAVPLRRSDIAHKLLTRRVKPRRGVAGAAGVEGEAQELQLPLRVVEGRNPAVAAAAALNAMEANQADLLSLYAGAPKNLADWRRHAVSTAGFDPFLQLKAGQDFDREWVFGVRKIPRFRRIQLVHKFLRERFTPFYLATLPAYVTYWLHLVLLLRFDQRASVVEEVFKFATVWVFNVIGDGTVSRLPSSDEALAYYHFFVSLLARKKKWRCDGTLPATPDTTRCPIAPPSDATDGMSSTEQTAFLQDWYRLGDGVDVPMEYTRTVWHLDTGMGSQLSPETVAKAQPYLERQAWAGGPTSDAYLALSRLKQLGFCGGTPNTAAAAVSHLPSALATRLPARPAIPSRLFHATNTVYPDARKACTSVQAFDTYVHQLAQLRASSCSSATVQRVDAPLKLEEQ